MATGTNGIATEGEAKTKLGYSGSVTTNKCCTKARAIAMGADRSKLTGYQDNQLVKYNDIVKNIPPVTINYDIIDYFRAILYLTNCTNEKIELEQSRGLKTEYVYPNGNGQPSISAIQIYYDSSTIIKPYPYQVRWNSSYNNYLSGNLPSSPDLWTGASGWLNTNTFYIERI